MGEIFKFERPDEALPFTGERFTSAAAGQIEVEHLHRYLQARDACRGRDVLDIASGEGYGSALLSQVARSVIGVEIDPAVVSHASHIYGRDNLSFMAGDARRIRLPDDAFDVVTSFETIEHFYEHDLFLREIRRVLRPGGVLIISTPDRDIYSPAGEPANRYHVHELSKDELCDALRKEFAHIALFRQRTLAGSVLIPDDLPCYYVDGTFTTYEKRDNAYLERSRGLPRAKYIVAYASNEPLSDKLCPASAYIETSQIEQASIELAAARQELANAQATLLEWNNNEQRWRSDITSIAGDLAAARQLLAQQDDALARLRAENQQAKDDSAATAGDLAAARQLLAQQDDALARLCVEAQQVRDDNASMAGALEQARAAAQQAEADVNGRSAALRSAEERAAALLGQDAAVRQELAELRARSRQLDQSLAAARETEAQLRQDHDRTARDLTAALAAAQQASKADAEAARMRSAFVDRFLGWRKLYPKPLSLGVKRSIIGARRFARRKNWGAAEARYRKILSDNPRLPRVWLQYAHVVKEQGDFWAAYGAYSHAVHLDPKIADTYVHLGHVQKQLGMTDEAAATLQQALQLRPSLSNVWQDLRNLGREDDELVTAVLRVNEATVPQDSGLGLRFKLARRRARAAARQRDWKLAADRYRKVLALAPNHARSWLMFGHALKESGDPVAAGTAYLQALVLDPINQEPRRHFDAVWQATRARRAPPVLSHEQGSARRSGVLTLRPGQELQQLDGGEFLSTGQDPQFALDAPGGLLPRGLTILTVETRRADPLLRPVLYAWSGDDVSSFELPSMTGAQTMEWTLQLPDHVTALRFDPTNEADVRFAIERIVFREREPLADGEVLPSLDLAQQEYEIWVRLYDTLGQDDIAAIRQQVEQLPSRPLLSIVMPVYNPGSTYLRRALDTVLAQLYSNWELCIADDASTNPEIRKILDEYAARDQRVKVVFRDENGHISAASNSALELVAGEFVVLMDHDDELPAHALYMVATELNRHPDTDVIYTDEDKIDANGRRHDPHFKTDWNSDLFYSQNFVAHLGVYRTSLVREVGGFRVGFEGSQDYDFALRILGKTDGNRIRHIPFVLYHWRIFPGVRTFSSNHPDKSVSTAYRALVDHFEKVGQDVEVLPIEAFPSWWRIKRQLPKPPSVTLIIPTRDRVPLLRGCVESILYRTSYPHLDVIIVDNGSIEAETLVYLRKVTTDKRVQVLRVDGPFNYSTLNNKAVEQARGDFIGFVNNDVQVIGPEWLTEMMSQAVRPGVGAVGAKLLYANGDIQHAGVTLGVYGVAAHGHRHFPANSIGYFGRPQLQQELSAVTAALLVMPKHLFRELGGFDEANLTVGYNDVDLCLRIREAGRRIIYTPFAELHHLESASRGANISPEQKERDRRERAYMTERWGSLLQQDPFYSVNLSLGDEAFRLAFPSRAVKPWLDEPGHDFPTREQRRFDREYRIDAEQLRAVAAQTTVVVASASSFGVFSRLVSELTRAHLAPARIVVVDTTDRGSDVAHLPDIKRLKRSHPEARVDLVRDDGQDFNLSRACNVGVRAAGEAEYLLVIAEDVRFSRHWFEYLLKAVLVCPGETVGAASICLPDGRIEEPTSLRDARFREVARSADGYDALPTPRSATEDEVAATRILRSDAAIGGGVFFGRRSLLCEGEDGLFDERLYAIGREEDLSRRLRAKGACFASTSASLVFLAEDRPRDTVHLWEHVHDYSWLNRKWAGERDSGMIEFVCPFHRGDVLIGLQVAAQARRMGRQIRMHVAESLVPWVEDFAPDFAVEAVPVPVPPAELTQLNLLRAYLHVVQRPDASPDIARSHPKRGLDSTNRNLVENMLEAVGLPRDTELDAFRPDPRRGEDAARLLAPYDGKAILVHRSGGWHLKTIPDAVLRELVATVKQRGFSVVQIGGPGDEQVSYLDGWITAGLSPAQWSAIFRRASALVGVDSWSAHLGSILDIPQVTLYGSTAPQHVNSKRFFADRRAPSLTLGPVVDCSPCNSLTCLRAPVDFCMGYALDQDAIGRFLDALPVGHPPRVGT